MAEISIPEKLWLDFVDIARARQQKPETLAAEALRDYLQRLADEELLARSEKAARRSKFRIEEAEQIVKRHRRKTRKD